MGELIPIRRELRESASATLACRCPITTGRRFLPQPGCPLHGSHGTVVPIDFRVTGAVSVYVGPAPEAA